MLGRFRLLLGALFLTLTLVLGAGCADASGAEASGSSTAAQVDTAAARDAREALEKAIKKKDETDVRLSRALGRVGAMLTPEQYSAFVKGFNQLPDVVALEADYHTRSAALAIEADKITADPMAVQAYGARHLFDDYVLLSTTPGARSSLFFAAKVLSGNLPLQGVSRDDAMEKVLGPAIAPAFLANLLEKGNVEEASNATVLLLRAGDSTCEQAADWLSKYKALDTHDIVKQYAGITSKTAIESLHVIRGFIAIWQVGSDLVAGDVNAALRDFLDSGPGAVASLADAVAMFRRAVLGIGETPLAAKIVKWSGKIGQGIGIVMTAIQLWNDAGKWNDSLDAKVRVIGDVVALGASVLMLCGVGGPVGPILAAVAIGITLFADWLEDRRLAEQESADLTACLPIAGIDATLTQTMIDSSPVLVSVLAKDVKLAPTDIQWLLKTDPTVVSATTYTPPVRFIGVQVAQVIFELDATETAALLKAAVGTTTAQDAQIKLDAFLNAIEFDASFRGDLTKAEALAWLTTEANDPLIQAAGRAKDLRKAAFLGAKAYLATR